MSISIRGIKKIQKIRHLSKKIPLYDRVFGYAKPPEWNSRIFRRFPL